ncbi:5-dehydro-2-deoxygluconokinase [Cohnella fermenti]|uniref:5-dehydro-2-deoxygluconokinase n=1 Tax=Cohnella fermenti TaxID=2565925 RepID=A0A4S4CAZ0_9BACL|nr:5-dehydro-2-deoxygluconokinase [Cohnella fermenti]THF84638.1 5-dehydro-2-deoxygluconokinase [Cohnella fermenti]
MSNSWFPDRRTLDCIGLGRLCIDFNANEIHRPIEKTLTFTKYVGGSPANITIAMARLGLRTGFLGRVSDDGFGRYIREYMNSEGIDTSRLATDDKGGVTGLAFTEILSPEQCSILMYRDNAADLNLEPGDIPEEYIRSSSALLVSGTALSRSPSREAVFRAIEDAKRNGTVVVMDIDYRPYSWRSREETRTYCRLAAAQADIVFGGREEFDLLDRNGEAGEDDEATAREWLDQGAKLVVVKRGEGGSAAFDRAGNRYRAGVYPAQVVKTFGAGDSFAGAFLFGLFRNWPIDRCLAWGSAAASIVVSSHSCSDAMPSREQIESVVDRYGEARIDAG